MAKVFDWDTRKGNYIDSVSRVNGMVTDLRFMNERRGLVADFNGSTSKYNFSLSLSGSFAINFWFKSDGNSSSSVVIEGNNVSSPSFEGSDGAYRFYLNTSGGYKFLSATTSVIKNKWYNIVLNYNESATTAELFVNGMLVASDTSTLWSESMNNIYVGHRDPGTLYTDCKIGKVSIYDSFLIVTDINRLYKEFQNSYPYKEINRPSYVDLKPMDLSNEDGLIAAYNMIPKNGQIIDISGNGNDGIITGCLTDKKGLISKGHNSNSRIIFSPAIINSTIWGFQFKFSEYVEGSSLDFLFGNGAGTPLIFLKNNIHFGFRDLSATYYFYDGTGNTENILTSDLTKRDVSISLYSDGTDIHAFINGIYKGYITPNDTTLIISRFFEAYFDNSWTPFIKLENVKIYNKVLTNQEVQDYHENFSSQIYFNEEFSDDAFGSSFFNNWQLGSGTFGSESTIIESEDYAPDEFVTKWSVPVGSFTFPAGNIGVYDAEINFNDGSGWYSVTAYNDSNLTHEYLVGGVYNIRIRGTFPKLAVNNGAVAPYLTEVIQLGDVGIINISGSYYGCINLVNDVNDLIPTSITVIGTNAFNNCTSIYGVPTFSATVIEIGESAFQSSNISGDLIIPGTITTIGNRAFRDCDFSGYTLSYNTTTAPSLECFYNCNFTGSLTLLSGLTSIGTSAFRGNNFTGGLTVPNTITTIGGFYEAGFTGNLILPEGVTTIQTSAFVNCGFTGALTFPSTLTTIGSFSFQGCTGFSGDLAIPASFTSVAEAAFRGCTGFDGLLTIPSSISSMGNFSFFNCTGFTRVDCYPSTAPTLASLSMNLNGIARPLHVPVSNSGYDVSPWTTVSIFSTIINDL